MRRHATTALAAMLLATATATAASADPLGGLLGSLFGGGNAQQLNAPYYQPTVAPTYAPETNRPAAIRIPREMVNFNAPYAPGTVVVSTSERRLYLVMPGNKALKYGIGVGRAGFEWSGTQTIARKQEWPDWVPPAEMLQRRPDLPRYMAGGPENPLGARAMYLGSSLYRIHGSNEPETIGQAVSSGCFRLLNDDVIDLYSRVRVGAKVIVMR